MTIRATFAIFVVHWIKKWSSSGCLLEHLEASGTKIMRGPILRQLWVERCRETKEDLKDNICGFNVSVFFCAAGLLPCEEFKARLEFFKFFYFLKVNIE